MTMPMTTSSSTSSTVVCLVSSCRALSGWSVLGATTLPGLLLFSAGCGTRGEQQTARDYSRVEHAMMGLAHEATGYETHHVESNSRRAAWTRGRHGRLSAWMAARMSRCWCVRGAWGLGYEKHHPFSVEAAGCDAWCHSAGMQRRYTDFLWWEHVATPIPLVGTRS